MRGTNRPSKQQDGEAIRLESFSRGGGEPPHSAKVRIAVYDATYSNEQPFVWGATYELNAHLVAAAGDLAGGLLQPPPCPGGSPALAGELVKLDQAGELVLAGWLVTWYDGLRDRTPEVKHVKRLVVRCCCAPSAAPAAAHSVHLHLHHG